MNSCNYGFIDASYLFWEVFIGTWNQHSRHLAVYMAVKATMNYTRKTPVTAKKIVSPPDSLPLDNFENQKLNKDNK